MNLVYIKEADGGFTCMTLEDWEACAPLGKRPEVVDSDDKVLKDYLAATEKARAESAIEAVRAALQAAIDARAQAMGFSNGNALMLYAGFENAFKATAQTFGTWEAQAWVEAGAYKNEVLAGTKPMVSPDDAVSMMPDYPEEPNDEPA